VKIINRELWGKSVHGNQDEYGAAVIRYAERWADLMEAQMQTGQPLATIWKSSSHKADTEGITGFMYGAAVSILAEVWEHGEDLRKLHNIDTQIQQEGERANETGGVLNPALLCVETKD